MKWFRMHSEILDDPKVAKMDGETFRVFVLLLALVAEQEDSGKIRMKMEDISWRLRSVDEKLSTAVAELTDLGCVKVFDACLIITNWNKRQYSTDHSAERMRKSRHRKRHSGVTPLSQDRRGDAPDTDTDTDTEKSRAEYNYSTARTRAIEPDTKNTRPHPRAGAVRPETAGWKNPKN